MSLDSSQVKNYFSLFIFTTLMLATLSKFWAQGIFNLLKQFMAIVPTESGCKLYMHSVDRPGGSIPSKIINWAAKNGIPSYLDVVNKACDDFVSSKWIDDPISQIEAFPKFTLISSSAFRWLHVYRKTDFHITLLTLKIFWKYLLLWPTRCPNQCNIAFCSNQHLSLQ